MTSQRPQHGYLNHTVVVRFSFWTIVACIAIAVVASVLAIWEFAGTGVLWRTVATCAVVAGGTMTFSLVNGIFGSDRE